MPHIGKANVVDKKIDKNQAGEILKLGDKQKGAQSQHQDRIVFHDCNKLHIIAPLKKGGVPVKEIVGQQMEEQNAENGSQVILRVIGVQKGASPGKKAQKVREDDGDTLNAQDGIILDDFFFLAEIGHDFSSIP